MEHRHRVSTPLMTTILTTETEEYGYFDPRSVALCLFVVKDTGRKGCRRRLRPPFASRGEVKEDDVESIHDDCPP